MNVPLPIGSHLVSGVYAMFIRGPREARSAFPFGVAFLPSDPMGFGLDDCKGTVIELSSLFDSCHNRLAVSVENVIWVAGGNRIGE